MNFLFLFDPNLLVVLVGPSLVVGVWAVIDALVRPDSDWMAADQNKTAWVIGLLVGPLVLFPLGIMVSLVYLVAIRSKLGRVARGYSPTARVAPE